MVQKIRAEQIATLKRYRRSMLYANELLNIHLLKDKQLALILKDALVEKVKKQLGKCMKVHTSYLATLC